MKTRSYATTMLGISTRLMPLIVLLGMLGCSSDTPPSRQPAESTTIAPESQRPLVAKQVEARCAEFDDRWLKAIPEHTRSVDEFFAKRKPVCRKLAQTLLSWEGKFELVKGKIGDDEGYRRFLRESFEQCLFGTEELRRAVDEAAKNYLSTVDGANGQFLVELQADLASEFDLSAIPEFRDRAAFESAYVHAMKQVASHTELAHAVSIPQLLVSQILSNVVTNIIAQAAGHLAVSGGILSSSAVSGIATLGLSLAVGILVDIVLDELLKGLGYDPETKLTETLAAMLGQLRDTIVLGDPTRRAEFARLDSARQASNDPDFVDETLARQWKMSLDGSMGLRWTLGNIYHQRALARNAALEQLVTGTPK